MPAAAAEIDLESDIVLPAEGPAVMGQGKLQGQQLEMYPLLFPQIGTKALSSGLTSESLLVVLIPPADSCVTPASLQPTICSFCWDPAHVFATDTSTHDFRCLCTMVVSSVSTPGPVYLSEVNSVLKIEQAGPPASWSASEDGFMREPCSEPLRSGSSGSLCQKSELGRVEENLRVQRG